ILVLTAVIGFFGVRDAGSMSHQSGAMLDGAVKPLAALGDARAAFNENRALVAEHILETNAAARSALEARLATNDKRIAADLGGRAPQSLGAFTAMRAQVLSASDADAFTLYKTQLAPLATSVGDDFA